MFSVKISTEHISQKCFDGALFQTFAYYLCLPVTAEISLSCWGLLSAACCSWVFPKNRCACDTKYKQLDFGKSMISAWIAEEDLDCLK